MLIVPSYVFYFLIGANILLWEVWQILQCWRVGNRGREKSDHDAFYWCLRCSRAQGIMFKKYLWVHALISHHLFKKLLNFNQQFHRELTNYKIFIIFYNLLNFLVSAITFNGVLLYLLGIWSWAVLKGTTMLNSDWLCSVTWLFIDLSGWELVKWCNNWFRRDLYPSTCQHIQVLMSTITIVNNGNSEQENPTKY